MLPRLNVIPEVQELQASDIEKSVKAFASEKRGSVSYYEEDPVPPYVSQEFETIKKPVASCKPIGTKSISGMKTVSPSYVRHKDVRRQSHLGRGAPPSPDRRRHSYERKVTQ